MMNEMIWGYEVANTIIDGGKNEEKSFINDFSVLNGFYGNAT